MCRKFKLIISEIHFLCIFTINVCVLLENILAKKLHIPQNWWKSRKICLMTYIPPNPKLCFLQSVWTVSLNRLDSLSSQFEQPRQERSYRAVANMILSFIVNHSMHNDDILSILTTYLPTLSFAFAWSSDRFCWISSNFEGCAIFSKMFSNSTHTLIVNMCKTTYFNDNQLFKFLTHASLCERILALTICNCCRYPCFTSCCLLAC